MSRLFFIKYMNTDAGPLAQMETKSRMPLNLYAFPESDRELKRGTVCDIAVEGVSYKYRLYRSEEDMRYEEPGVGMDMMIPIGARARKGEYSRPEAAQTHYNLFTGTILDASRIEGAKEDESNWIMTVSTFDMDIRLRLHYDSEIKPGYVIYAGAWLFAVVRAGA